MEKYNEGKDDFNKKMNCFFIQTINILLVYSQILANVSHRLVFYFTNKKFLYPESRRKSAWKSAHCLALL